jgi:hypothetical protein
MAISSRSSRFLSRSTKICPLVSNCQATLPAVPRLPPFLTKICLIFCTVRFRLSVAVSTRKAVPAELRAHFYFYILLKYILFLFSKSFDVPRLLYIKSNIFQDPLFVLFYNAFCYFIGSKFTCI